MTSTSKIMVALWRQGKGTYEIHLMTGYRESTIYNELARVAGTIYVSRAKKRAQRDMRK